MHGSQASHAASTLRYKLVQNTTLPESIWSTNVRLAAPCATQIHQWSFKKANGNQPTNADSYQGAESIKSERLWHNNHYSLTLKKRETLCPDTMNGSAQCIVTWLTGIAVMRMLRLLTVEEIEWGLRYLIYGSVHIQIRWMKKLPSDFNKHSRSNLTIVHLDYGRNSDLDMKWIMLFKNDCLERTEKTIEA